MKPGIWLALILVGAWRVASADEADLTRPGPTTKLSTPSKRHVFGIQWSAPIVRQGFFRTVPVSLSSPGVASAQGVVLVGTGEGELRGYRSATGELLWRRDFKVPFLGPISVFQGADPFAVTTRADGMLLAFEISSGEVRWQTQIDGDSLAPARLAGDRLFVSTAQNKVIAVSVKTGERLWTSGRPKASALTIRGHSAPAVDADAVFATFSDGYVECYSSANGTRLWSRPLALDTQDFADSDADPVLTDGKLFVASYDKGVFALQPADGKTLWAVAAPAVTNLRAHREMVVVGSADGFVWALSQKDGTLQYRVQMPPGDVSRMATSGDLLVFTSGDTGLVALRASTGEPLQATPFLGRVSGAPDVDGDFVAAISSRGYVYTMRLDAPGRMASRANWGRP